MIQHKWCKAEHDHLVKVNQGNFLLYQPKLQLSSTHLFKKMIKCELHCDICVKSHLVWKFLLDDGGPFDINLPKQKMRRIYGAMHFSQDVGPKCSRDPNKFKMGTQFGVKWGPKEHLQLRSQLLLIKLFGKQVNIALNQHQIKKRQQKHKNLSLDAVVMMSVQDLEVSLLDNHSHIPFWLDGFRQRNPRARILKLFEHT